MKTFEQILKETVEGDRFSGQETFDKNDYYSFECVEIAARIYASQCGKQALLNAIDRVKDFEGFSIYMKGTIERTEIPTP